MAFAVSVGVAWLDLTSFEQYRPVLLRFSPRSKVIFGIATPPAETSGHAAAVAHQLALGKLVASCQAWIRLGETQKQR